MAHDALFKELLRAFFREFLELFFPDAAERLDFSRVSFLDKELFTDLPEGSRRELDLLAQTYTRDGEPELILVHVEVQARREREFPYRMFEYYALLRLRHRVPVFPVVIYLSPGAGGLMREQYAEAIFGRDVLTFRYDCVGLPDLSADDYLERENPLAPALSALMKPAGAGRALQKALALRQTLLGSVDEARQSLLVNLVETCLKLDAAEEQAFRQVVGQQELGEVRRMLTIYEERGIIIGKRDTLLQQLRLKFGELPESVVARVQELDTSEELETLLARILTAGSLSEMGLV